MASSRRAAPSSGCSNAIVSAPVGGDLQKTPRWIGQSDAKYLGLQRAEAHRHLIAIDQTWGGLDDQRHQQFAAFDQMAHAVASCERRAHTAAKQLQLQESVRALALAVFLGDQKLRQESVATGTG